MKLLLSTIIAAVIFFLLGWLLYGVILMGMELYTKGYAAVTRGEDTKMWAIAVGCLTEAFFLALIYPKFYKGGSPASEGFKFGLYMCLLLCVPYVFYMWGNMTVTWQAVIADAIAMIINTFIACMAIGLVYGKIEKPAA
jgi:hypothetical protein